ncbi:exodeoxyribonuclease III [Myxococcota bacterium]|nr:exodeoxyribonuclease III [Myxococcota bacterium]MBU1900301.1 exodeoxyribonuclease III [Myxococcota bacterium]
MRLISWNVNGVRAVVRKGFFDWLSADQADVICLQETKIQADQLTPALRSKHGYHTVWAHAEQGGYSGVATFSKVAPDEIIIGIGDPQFDDEGRTITTRYDNLVVINGYFPNGGRDLKRVPYKLDYYSALFDYAQRLRAQGRDVVICGDWNTAHHEIDLKNWKGNQKATGFLPEERAVLDDWVAAGWVDTFRKLHPGEEGCYTWWAQRPGVRERNVGWRIDYHFVNEEMWPRVRDALIHPNVLGSDHCPIELVVD